MPNTTVIDHRHLRSRLHADRGTPHGVYRTADSTGTVINLEDPSPSQVLVTAEGRITLQVGADKPEDIGHAQSTDEAFNIVWLYLKQHTTWVHADKLLEVLESIPSSVAHYAVEDAKSALIKLRSTAYTIDFLHGL